MTSSALPPPPPPPPSPSSGPPSRSGSEWKDQTRPPVVPFADESRWGIGDALISFVIFLVTSIGLVSITVFLDADPLVGFWFPLLLAGPQLTQGAFTIGVSREKGAGLDRDFGFRFRRIDLLLGFALLILGFVLAGGTAALMEQLGLETPEASVAELIDDASESDDTSDTFDADDADGGSSSDDTTSGNDDDDSSGDGVTVWIVMVAIFAATAVPVIEELIYRGLWWSALLKRGVPEWATLLITSLLFAAAHLEPGRFPVLFVLGLALGLGRVLTGRIGASIVTHACINGIAMAVLLATI